MIKVGSFETEQEAVNCLRYLKTDFAGFLLGIITPTQDATRKNYRLIPLVDFKTGEVLDTGKFLDFNSPATLDEQLAKMYELSDEDMEVIRRDLKPWMDKVDVKADR